MKNTGISIKDKLVQKYLDKEPEEKKVRSTNINILLNNSCDCFQVHLISLNI